MLSTSGAPAVGAAPAVRGLELLARVLFAAGTIGLAITHFTFGEFTTGRAPEWPEAVPGGAAWAVLTGAALLAAGIAILAGRWPRPAALFAAALVFAWALVRQVPVAFASPFPSGEWTDLGKAVRFVAGALAVAAIVPAAGGGANAAVGRLSDRRDRLILVARIATGPTLVLNGAQHFVYTQFVAGLIPDAFPGNAEFWTWFGGVALIAGGLGLLLSRTAGWAALLSGIMIFSWFFIVHLPREIAGVADGLAVFEVLATAGPLFAIAAFLLAPRGRRVPPAPAPRPARSSG